MKTEAELPSGWRHVRFDQIMQRVERKLLLDDTQMYARVGVRWYGNGAFVRDRVPGGEITRKQQWILRSGDVVYNKLFAWKGAFAIADNSVDGHIVSDKFPTFSLDSSQVDPRYLGYYFRTHPIAFQAERLSKGAAAISKLTLNPPQFWDLTIPVPPSLDSQESIVSMLVEAEGDLEVASQLRSQADAETDALITSAIGASLAPFPGEGSLGQVLTEKPRNGWSAPCANAPDGIPVLSLGAVTGFTFRTSSYKRTSEPTDPEAHYWLRAGDLLVTRSNTERLLGHAAIYNGDPSPCIYPDLMMRLKVDLAKADTRFVWYWLRSPQIRSIIERAGRGTSSTMKKITQGHVMALPFPTGIDLEIQQEVVRRLDEIIARVDAARAVQRSGQKDLAALMPALLDRAFRGEL